MCVRDSSVVVCDGCTETQKSLSLCCRLFGSVLDSVILVSMGRLVPFGSALSVLLGPSAG